MTCTRIGNAIVCGRGPSRPRSAPIGEKAAHVRSAGQTRNHTCHWPGCERQVPPAMWGCKEHWFSLPPEIRSRIWHSYQVGQEETGRPGRAYVEAAHAAQEWIQTHHPPQDMPPPRQGALPL